MFDGEVIGTASIGEDVTERKRTEVEREQLLRELRRSNEELEQFARVAGHDLRSPIQSISNLIQLFARRYAPKLDGRAVGMVGGSVTAGPGAFHVGALVGHQNGNSINNSFATTTVSAGVRTKKSWVNCSASRLRRSARRR